jgi:O-antigen/teichoic acid export membrane protein
MRKYAIPILTRYASVFIQFCLVVVVTRSLGRDDAGQYFVIMGLVLATYFMAGAGLPDGMVRFAPALAATNRCLEADRMLDKGFKLSLATIPLCAAIGGSIVAAYTDSGVTGLLAGLWWASYGTIFVCAQLTVARRRSELGTAMFYSAASIGQLLISAPWILLLGLHRLDAVLLANVVGTSTSALVCMIIASRMSVKASIPGESLRDAWKQGLTIAIGRVIQSCLLWSPVWVVGFTLGPSDAALVGLASRLVSAIAAVLAAVRFAIRPKLAHDAAQQNWRAIERHASQIAFYTTALAICACIVAASTGNWLIALAFGGGFGGAGFVTALMLIGTVGESIGGPVDEVLKMAGHATDVLIAQVAVLVVGVGAQFFAARLGGVDAMALIYSLMFVLLYLGLIARLWFLHGIVIVPKLMKHAP